MRVVRLALTMAFCALVAIPFAPVYTAPSSIPAYQRFLSPASPLEVVAAAKIDRLAWVAFEEGRRNAYTAVAPAFTPVRLTSFTKDDGVDLSTIRISSDGSTVVFVRGTAPNRDGWVANPSANPDGPERAVWAARTAGGPAFRVAEASSPELAPDGSAILFVKDGQIHRAKVTAVKPVSEMDRGEKPFIKEWGAQSTPQWSPDGKKIAFVSTRTDHSFVVVYDVATRAVRYMAPSVDFDTSPMWTKDGGDRFLRRPDCPCAAVAAGNRCTGASKWTSVPAARPGRPGCQGRQGAPGAAGTEAARPPVPVLREPRLARAGECSERTTHRECARHAARDIQGRIHAVDHEGRRRHGGSAEVWHNQSNDRIANNLTNPASLAITSCSHSSWLAVAAVAGRGERHPRNQIPLLKAPSTNGIATIR